MLVFLTVSMLDLNEEMVLEFAVDSEVEKRVLFAELVSMDYLLFVGVDRSVCSSNQGFILNGDIFRNQLPSMFFK